MTYDAIILGAGPAGLGAALALARDGARVAVVEANTEVGGLCRTLRRGELAYDLGGHILFVNDDRRRAWLQELLGDDAIWVDRPVVCVRGGLVTAGRYLDQRPPGSTAPNGAGPSAHAFLAESFGGPFVDEVMRRYLEKVDGIPLERILATRARNLMLQQVAPSGFWYAAGGIGQLMGAMADEIGQLGGELVLGARVRTIEVVDGAIAGVGVDGPDGPARFASPRVIAGLPPALVAGLVDPAPPPDLIPSLAPRAAALVYLSVATQRVTEHAWIQVDHPDAPFARLSEVPNWSERLVPDDRTVLGCEVYCHPHPDDRWWALSDAALAEACARALCGPLGLVGDPTTITPLEVVRLPRAWSLVEVDQLDAAMRPMEWLNGIDGLRVAQGGDVILAIAAGEDAARSQ